MNAPSWVYISAPAELRHRLDNSNSPRRYDIHPRFRCVCSHLHRLNSYKIDLLCHIYFFSDGLWYRDDRYDVIADHSNNRVGGEAAHRFESQSARYVRVTVTGAAGYTGDWTSISDIRIFETLSLADSK